jgi:uncharacterized protein YfeS
MCPSTERGHNMALELDNIMKDKEKLDLDDFKELLDEWFDSEEGCEELEDLSEWISTNVHDF